MNKTASLQSRMESLNDRSNIHNSGQTYLPSGNARDRREFVRYKIHF